MNDHDKLVPRNDSDWIGLTGDDAGSSSKLQSKTDSHGDPNQTEESGGQDDNETLDEDAVRIRKDVEWTIDNKYYTARVRFKTSSQEYFEMSEAEDVEVIMYILSGQVSSFISYMAYGPASLRGGKGEGGGMMMLRWRADGRFRSIHYRQWSFV